MYHFISGYTAKVAGTEVGVTEPQATFSPCFGGPFLVWHPAKYAEMLADKMRKHKANVWLVNTGWSGGGYGVGKRMKLAFTRAIIDAIHGGQLTSAPTERDPVLGSTSSRRSRMCRQKSSCHATRGPINRPTTRRQRSWRGYLRTISRSTKPAHRRSSRRRTRSKPANPRAIFASSEYLPLNQRAILGSHRVQLLESSPNNLFIVSKGGAFMKRKLISMGMAALLGIASPVVAAGPGGGGGAWRRRWRWSRRRWRRSRRGWRHGRSSRRRWRHALERRRRKLERRQQLAWRK